MRRQCLSRNGNLAYVKGRNATPPGLPLAWPLLWPSVTLRRWLHTPPSGEFEQAVLYRYGPAQVGFDQFVTSCSGLVAPFTTEPTMPAAHTVPKLQLGNSIREALLLDVSLGICFHASEAGASQEGFPSWSLGTRKRWMRAAR